MFNGLLKIRPPKLCLMRWVVDGCYQHALRFAAARARLCLKAMPNKLVAFQKFCLAQVGYSMGE
jgi:hypothetical protein